MIIFKNNVWIIELDANKYFSNVQMMQVTEKLKKMK